MKKDDVFGIDDIKKRLHEARLIDASKADLTTQTFVFEPARRKVHLRFGDGTGAATFGKLATLELNNLWRK